jgi:hypothetical protein
MRRLCGAFQVLSIMVLIQSLSGCAWVENDPIVMKVPSSAEQATPCIAVSLGKEFQDSVPVVDHGIKPGSLDITVNAQRGGVLAFVTVEPIGPTASDVTFYNGLLYWPKREIGGVFPDLLRDNWHRAERAILSCSKPA